MTGIVELRHAELHPSPLNPRKHARSAAEIEALAASIAERGILQNLVVRPHYNKEDGGDGYEIAAGEGRWRAVQWLIDQGKTDADFKLPVAIRELSDEDVIEIGLIENTQRNDLHPLDEARAFFDLYERRGKQSGKKAAAKVVDDLAARLNRTPRYVQKRIKIARDLIPEWTALLENGTISVAVAQVVSAASADDQRDAFENITTGFGKSERLDEVRARGLSVKEVSAFFTDSWRPMATALFDASTYDGAVEEIDGELYATETERFDELQKIAAAGIMRVARIAAKEGDIAFVEQGENFVASRYNQKKLADGTPDPAGGIYIEKRKSGEIFVFRGLFLTEEAKADDEREHKRKSAAAKERAKQARQRAQNPDEPAKPPKPIDPRPAAVHAFLLKKPETRNAVALFSMLSTYQNSIRWLHDDFDIGRVEKFLADASGGKVPKGEALLPWLLELKPALINAAHAHSIEVQIDLDVELIAKPSKLERILFDHCGAKLPDELALPKGTKNAKAAGLKRTASKSKPKPKNKKGKK